MMKRRGFVLQYLHARDETCRITTWLLMFFSTTTACIFTIISVRCVGIFQKHELRLFGPQDCNAESNDTLFRQHYYLRFMTTEY